MEENCSSHPWLGSTTIVLYRTSYSLVRQSAEYSISSTITARELLSYTRTLFWISEFRAQDWKSQVVFDKREIKIVHSKTPQKFNVVIDFRWHSPQEKISTEDGSCYIRRSTSQHTLYHFGHDIAKSMQKHQQPALFRPYAEDEDSSYVSAQEWGQKPRTCIIMLKATLWYSSWRNRVVD